MIKGALQLCQMLFGANMFCFDDNSNIDCGVTNLTQKIPRKLTNAFALAYLSIAEKGKTWYENNFNAFIKDANARDTYYKAI